MMKLFVSIGRGNGKSLQVFEEIAETFQELTASTGDALKKLGQMLVSEAAKLEAEASIPPELLEEVEDLRAYAQDYAEAKAKLQELAEYEEDEAKSMSCLTREEWREVEALDAQKAAARARSYAGALTMEKAREVRRRRKWRKRIDDRVHTVRSFRTVARK